MLLAAIAGSVVANEPTHREVVTLRDGYELQANIWLPDGRGPWPVVLQRFYQAGGFPFGRQRFLDAGYVTVHTSIRDADGTEGTRFTRDDLDGYDTVEWVASQSWCDGRVAMYGKSAGGITAFAAATARPPHLRAIVPMNSGETWRWGYRANGAVTLAMAANGRAVPDLRKRPWRDSRDAFMLLPLRDLDLRGRGEENPLWNQIVENSAWNDFYRGKRLKVELIQVPTLIIGGWWDYYAGSAFRHRAAIKRANPELDVRVLIGATNHVSQLPADGREYPGGRENASGEAVRWLDSVLRGRENGVRHEPPIKVFTMRNNRWQQYSDWPPVKEPTRFYLHKGAVRTGGQLRATHPENDAPTSFTYDPRDPVPTLGGNHSLHFEHPLVPVGSFDHSAHEDRTDVLVFSTDALTSDKEVTGPIAVKLWAATDAPDTDWTVILLDVEPDGTPYNVTMGILRGRYRGGVYEPPQPITPGSVAGYNLELMPTSYTFKRGHRIRLYVSSSNFPLWDRNPNTGGPIGSETQLRVARQRVFHDAKRASYIDLPVVNHEVR